MTMLSFRVDEREASELRRWTEQLGIARSQLLREALRRYLVKLGSDADAATWERIPATDAEQALAGVADWGPAEDWSDWADATG